MASEIWLVKKDGRVLFEGTSYDGCWLWINRHQDMSVDWAMKYAGYKIVHADK